MRERMNECLLVDQLYKKKSGREVGEKNSLRYQVIKSASTRACSEQKR